MMNTNDKFYIREISGLKFSILELPNSGFFRYETATDMGSDFEAAYLAKTGRWVHGMAHLIEHLSFKSPKDYTSDELIKMLKVNGDFNAYTDTDRIHYYYNTISNNFKLAISLVANITFNDLTMVDASEFESERSVVANEIRRYQDDAQTIFGFQARAVATGRNLNDNILGVPELLENFTLHDCSEMKKHFIQTANIVHRITFDPNDLNLEDITSWVVMERNRINEGQGGPSINISRDEYEAYRRSGIMVGEPIHLNSTSGQCLISVYAPFSGMEVSLPIRQAIHYVGYMAETSVNELIRERHGLTYGIHLSSFTLGKQHIMTFSVDVEQDKFELVMRLIADAFQQTVERFGTDDFKALSDKFEIQTVNSRLNRSNQLELHGIPERSPGWIKYASLYSEDANLAGKKITTDWLTFDNVKNCLCHLNDIIQRKKFLIVRT